MKKAFTITELLVAVGLLAAVLAASMMVFRYSIDAQRTASATAEIMRTLRSITGQLDIDFQGLQTDGYLFLRSEQVSSTDANNLDAIYYFSTGDYQSWVDSSVRSNIARIFLGHSRTTYSDRKLPAYLARDIHLLTPGYSSFDYNNVDFATCQTAIVNKLEDPNRVLAADRPDTSSTDVRSLLAQRVGSFKIEWTYGWIHSAAPDRIVWWGSDSNDLGTDSGLIKPDGNSVNITGIPTAINETKGPPYTVQWDPTNQSLWPKALKFTFTLYDSKGILKGGRKFEHIIYIGQ